MKKFNLIAILIILGGFRLVFGQITFNYTGGMQSYTIPLGANAMCYTVCGAKGMNNVQGSALGGLGGRIIGVMPVTPGQVIQIFVGGGGITSQLGGFNGGANGGICTGCATDWGGGGGGASDIRFAPYGLANRQAVGGGGGGTGGNRVVGCAPGCGGGGGGGYYGGGGGGAYGGSPGFGGSQVAGGLGGASCCGCPLAPQPGAAGIFGAGGNGGGLTGGNNQAANNPGCAGGVGGALIGGQGPNCTGGTGCPSTWAGASGGGGSNFAAGGGTVTSSVAGVQAGNGVVIINPNCCNTPSLVPIANPTAICIGQTSTLTVSGAGVGGTYTWMPGGSNATLITVSPTVTTIYTVQGTTSFSCTGMQTVQVTVNPLPVVLPASNSTICSGNTLSLTVGAGATYTWTGPNAFLSNVQNPTIAGTTTLNAGVYTVSVTSAFGCVASGTTNVVITPPTIINPTNTGPYCAGATISLTVGGALSYTWAGPNLFASNLQNPTIPNAQVINGGTYTVTVGLPGGCASTGTTNVVVNALPTPTATSNNPVCIGQPINFTGLGGATYTWSGPAFLSNAQNPVIAVAQLTNAGTYTLGVTNFNGCINTTTISLVINSLPTITTANQTVCANAPINLFAGGATSYTWTGPNGFSSFVQNPVIPIAQNFAGNFTVVGASALTCTNFNVSNIVVLAIPVPVIVSNAPLCFGGTLNLSGSGGTTYNWTGPLAFTSTLQSPSIPNVTLPCGGPYTLVVTSGICSGSTTANIVVNPLPTPTITSNSPVCLLQPLNLIAPGGYNFTWAGPNGFSANGSNPNVPSASNINAGTYTATATDGNGCTNTVTTLVVINPLPVISAIGSTICAGKTISLSATGGTLYTWSGPLGFTSNAQTPQIIDSDISMLGQYTVVVVNANGCISSSVTNVQINSLPTVTMSVNSPICASQSVSFTAGSVSALTYIWNGPNGFTSMLQNPTFTNTETGAAGLYTVTVIDNIGCSAKGMVALAVNALPIVKITSNKTSGCVPICITFSTQSSSPLQNCTWQFGDGSTGSGLGTVSKCFTYAGGYNITSKFSDVNGCSNTSTFSIEANPIPVADFNFEPSKPITNENVEFTDASRGAIISGWTWSFSHIKNKVVLKPITNLTFEDAGKYAIALIVTSDKGCKDTIVKSITVGEDFGVYVPDVFTPNGDGINDVFQPKGFGIVKYELNIFDRWGEKMFTTTDFNQGWDGSFPRRTHELVKEDVYVWHIKLLNVFGKQKELSGKVTLTK